MGETRNEYRILVGSHIKWPFGRPIRRWEINTKMDIRQTGCKYGRRQMEVAPNGGHYY
jgi:hypothetical protein